MAALALVLFLAVDIPSPGSSTEHVPVLTVLQVPAIAACAVTVVAVAGTISMLEPVLSLHLGSLAVTPGRIGIVYGVAAVATTTLHPICGRLADRFGARHVTMFGVVLTATMLPLLAQAAGFRSAVGLYLLVAAAAAFIITPSLALMGQATSEAGVQSFGVAYGLYNLAWGAGLLGGPALGGFLLERIGFRPLVIAWAPAVALVALVLARVKSSGSPHPPIRQTL
jgi:MFS family permease